MLGAAVEESVQSFRTLSGEAVRLWRALSALKQVIVRVVPAESKNELSSAVRTLAQLNSLFERCVQNWMDDEASRYAEVLANCIELANDPRFTYTVLEKTSEFRKFGGPIQLPMMLAFWGHKDPQNDSF